MYYSDEDPTSPRHARDREVSDPRVEAAARLAALGRALMDHGRTREAEESWHAALHHWAELVADHPDDVVHRERWLDGLNDAAWSLVALPEREPQLVARAIQWAEEAIEQEPRKAAYWNTLGIAYFRAGEWKASIHALERSVEQGTGGTSFDYFFLAMAYCRQGDKQAASHWHHLANDWMDQHNPEHEDLLRFREEAGSLIGAYPIPALSD